MTPTSYATAITLPPGTGHGPDLRESLSEDDQTDVDCLARLQAGPFPVIAGREWCIEAYQELLDANNYALGGALTVPGPKADHPDWPLWVQLRSLILMGCSLARELCRRRAVRETGR